MLRSTTRMHVHMYSKLKYVSSSIVLPFDASREKGSYSSREARSFIKSYNKCTYRANREHEDEKIHFAYSFRLQELFWQRRRTGVRRDTYCKNVRGHEAAAGLVRGGRKLRLKAFGWTCRESLEEAAAGSFHYRRRLLLSGGSVLGQRRGHFMLPSMHVKTRRPWSSLSLHPSHDLRP